MSVVVRPDHPPDAERGADARPSRERLRDVAALRFERSMEVPTRFFATHADTTANACLAMAHRFQQSGRLLVFGLGAEATDAQHVSV